MSVCVCIPHKRTRIRLASDFQQHLVLSTMESCLENCDFSVLHILSHLTLLTTLQESMLDIKWKPRPKVTCVSNHSDYGQSHPGRLSAPGTYQCQIQSQIKKLSSTGLENWLSISVN